MAPGRDLSGATPPREGPFRAIEFGRALDGAPGFIAEAVAELAKTRGEDDELVRTGGRILASLEAIPDDALVTTEADLAAAIHKAYPDRRNTASAATLTAAVIIAALKTTRP